MTEKKKRLCSISEVGCNIFAPEMKWMKKLRQTRNKRNTELQETNKNSNFFIYVSYVGEREKVLSLLLFWHQKVRGVFNKIPDFFVQVFRIVADSWKFSMLLLYVLWDDKKRNYDFSFKWTATAAIGIHPTKGWLSQLVNFKNAIWTLEERYTIKFCFKLGKNATETYGMLQTTFRPSCMNRASVFEWHKRFKKGRESVRDDKWCGRSTEFNTP